MIQKIDVKLTEAMWFRIPEEERHLFPDCDKSFKIESDDGEDIVCVKEHLPSWPAHVHLKRTKWFKSHPGLKGNDRIRVYVVIPLQKYRLEIVK